MRNRYLYITLLAVLGWNAETCAQDGARQVPRLVVNISIDQLDGDLLESLAPRYGDQGFKLLLQQGLVYENATFPLSHIDRASAISSVVTGTWPYNHGIVGERWINKESLRPQFSTELPEQSNTPTPAHLLVSTIGDELKMGSDGQARVFAIAPYRDAAILSAGHAADGAFWIDTKDCRWKTSQYYSSDSQTELLVFNKLFHRSLKGRKKQEAYLSSGLVNADVTELALQCIADQSMGTDTVTDLLCLTYNAAPLYQKSTSPQQHELENIYVQLDRAIGNLISRTEERVGSGRVLFVISGTGYTAPEDVDYARYRIPTGTFYINRAAGLLNMYAGAVWGQGRYIETYFDNQLFVNHKLLEQKRISLTDFNLRAREFLLQMEGVRNVYTGLQLLSEHHDETARMRNSYHPQRCGDLLVEVAPGWHLQNEDTGEDHLSQSWALPCPVILYGANVTARRVKTSVTADRIAPTISRAIRIRAPNACTSEPLI